MAQLLTRVRNSGQGGPPPCNSTTYVYPLNSHLTVPSVGPDGTVYAAMEVNNEIVPASSCLSGPATYQGALSLLQVSSNGSITTSTVETDTSDLSLSPGEVIPDGNGGALVSWGTTSSPSNVADISASGTTNSTLSSFRYPATQMVLGDSGSGLAYATDTISSIAAFNIGGSSVWTYTPPSGYHSPQIIAATAGDVLSITTTSTTSPYSQTLLSLSNTGTPTSAGVTGIISGLLPDLSSLLGIANNSFAEFIGPEEPLAFSFFPLRGGNFQAQSAALPISIRINFTGSKTSSDNLMFSNAVNTCSETLGLQDCTIFSGYRLWNLEGNARVYNDASQWTVAVTNEYAYKGYFLDGNNNLQRFSCSEPVHSDGPDPFAIQQPSGQQSIFYIDAPGPYWGIIPSNQCAIGTGFIDSETDILNFQVTYTSKLSSYHRTAYYFVK
jgi:hypothetical protein